MRRLLEPLAKHLIPLQVTVHTQMPPASRPAPLTSIASHNSSAPRASFASEPFDVPLSPLLSPSAPHAAMLRFPQTPAPYTMSRAGMMLTSGAFCSPSQRSHRSVRLKDLGSGHGFMHSENVFLYRARRTYLHDDTTLSRIVPPADFMSRSQLRRLMAVGECMRCVATSPRVSRIRWLGQRGGEAWANNTGMPRRTGLDEIANADAWDKARTARTAATFIASPHGRRESSQNSKRGSRGNKRSSQSSSGSSSKAYADGEWELTEQAGCPMYINKATGDVREVSDSTDNYDFSNVGEEIGTGSLAYNDENSREVENLLDFLEGRRARLE